MKTLSVTAFVAAILPTMLSPGVPDPTRSDVKHSSISAAAALPPAPAAGSEIAATTDVTKSAAPTPAAKEPEIDEDLYCLALNIYHEARSEPESGQIAVARVTLNRVASKSFPSSICAVVQQGGEKRHRCQFSWWCDGKSDQPTESRAWRRSLEISRRVLANEVSDPTYGALYYHADYVQPSWSSRLKRTTRIGRHLFYRPARRSSTS